MSTIWRIAPDEGGKQWDALRADRCVAIGWDDLPDFRAFQSLAALREKLRTRAEGDGRGGARRIWRFAHEMNVGDLVIVNRGESVLLGIGVVSSDYLKPIDHDNPRRHAIRLTHARRVEWIDVEETQLAKRFFGVRPNTLGSMNEANYLAMLDAIGSFPSGAGRMHRLLLAQVRSQGDALSIVNESIDASMLADLDAEALEGAKRLALVAHYHRDQRFRRRLLATRTSLRCEGCGFDFEEAYGELGKGYAHVHHEDPIAGRGGDVPTTASRVRIVCANCHAMIHRHGKCLTVEQLRATRRLPSHVASRETIDHTPAIRVDG